MQQNLGACPVVTVGNDGHDVTIDARVTIPAPHHHGTHSTPPPSPGLTADRDGYTVTMPVTMADIAKFRPDPGVDHMQPNGWMIVGLPTNFYATAAQQIKKGTLLDKPAAVRFTPARYSWSYGDGATRETSTPGATWGIQHLQEFDATATSHIYRDAGRYTIDLSIGFSAEYHYATDASWVPIAGLLWVPANRLVAVAGAGAKTVLVEEECTINPFGPGC